MRYNIVVSGEVASGEWAWAWADADDSDYKL